MSNLSKVQGMDLNKIGKESPILMFVTLSVNETKRKMSSSLKRLPIKFFACEVLCSSKNDRLTLLFGFCVL